MKRVLLAMLAIMAWTGMAQAQPVTDSAAYSNAISGAWAGGGNGGMSNASVSGILYGNTYNSTGPEGGVFRQFRMPGNFSHPWGPGYTGPWGQAHNFGVPVLLKVFSDKRLANMGFSWWNTTSNNKWVEKRDYPYCNIELEMLPSKAKDGIIEMPEIPMGGNRLIGYVNVRATSEKADSLDVLVRGMEEARKAGANRLIVWSHNVTMKMKGRNYGVAAQAGGSSLSGENYRSSFGGDVTFGFSSNESGPDVRPYIRAIAIEEGNPVPCK
jgi:hypothetical protein